MEPNRSWLKVNTICDLIYCSTDSSNRSQLHTQPVLFIEKKQQLLISLWVFAAWNHSVA